MRQNEKEKRDRYRVKSASPFRMKHLVFFRFKEEEDGLVFSKNLYIWPIHGHYITECKNAILMKNNKKRPLEKYLAPTAEVVQVDVERGFAVSAPGYGDGGPW